MPPSGTPEPENMYSQQKPDKTTCSLTAFVALPNPILLPDFQTVFCLCILSLISGDCDQLSAHTLTNTLTNARSNIHATAYTNIFYPFIHPLFFCKFSQQIWTH